MDDPLRVLISACLLGVRCGVDGTSYGAPFAHIERLLGLPNVRTVAFCPEDLAFGTPRETPDIHDGTGPGSARPTRHGPGHEPRIPWS
ncbi:MAG: hypothetical protein M3Y91_16970 [Actinomycetota bacterium]|nr:hypothetical protein [Actinomycetota bacterium]